MKKICIGFFFALLLGLFALSANAAAENARDVDYLPSLYFTLDVDKYDTEIYIDDFYDYIGEVDPNDIYYIEFISDLNVDTMSVYYIDVLTGYRIESTNHVVYNEYGNWNDDFYIYISAEKKWNTSNGMILCEVYLNDNTCIGDNIATPNNITFNYSGGDIVYSWDKVRNADEYYFVYSYDEETWYSMYCSTNSTSIDNRGGKAFYSVAAVVDRKIGHFSEIACTDAYGLNAPQNMSVTQTSTSVTVSWDKVTKATDYIFRYSLDNKKWTAKKTSKTTATAKGLKPGTVVYYEIIPVRYGEKGKLSATGKITTLKSFEAPKSVKATAAKESITVSWKKVSGATQYKVGYSYDSKNWNYKTVSSTSCKITGLKAGTKIYYAVQAISGSTTGAWSNTANITTNQVLPAPTNIKAAPDTYSFTVTWDKVKGADWYKFGYSTNGKTWYYKYSDTNSITINRFGESQLENGTIVSDISIKPNTKYYYAVASVSGKSALSQTVGTWSSTATVVTSAVQKQYYPGTNIPVYDSSYANYSYSDGVYTYSYYPEFPLLGPTSYPMALVNEGFTSAGTDKYSGYTVKYFYNSRYNVAFLIPNSAWDYIIVKYSSVY